MSYYEKHKDKCDFKPKAQHEYLKLITINNKIQKIMIFYFDSKKEYDELK